MLRSSRWVIASVVFLTGGLWLLFSFCHGDAGLAFALPVAASKVSLNISTMGWPVLVGIPLLAIGTILLVATFFVALIEQFTGPRVRTVDRPIPPRSDEYPPETKPMP